MQQTVAWLPEMSILDKASNVECKVFSIVCVSRGNLIWGVCIEMGIEPRMWLCAGSRNGPRINKRCIKATLNRPTSGLFIWPHLQESTRCPPAGPRGWQGSVWYYITTRNIGKMFVSFIKHARFQFSIGQLSYCNSTPLSLLWISGVFPSQAVRKG